MTKNIAFGASTWLWTSPFQTGDADALFEKIAGMGYDYVEIAVEDPALLDLPYLKNALAQQGLDVRICGAFGPSRDLTHEDPSVQKNGIAYIVECLDICAALGSPFLAGPMYSAVGKARMLPAEERKIEWDRAVTNLRKVAEEAEKRGLKIALEPLNRFESDLVNTADDVLRLLDDIQHPSAGICLDMFHMNIEEPDAELALVKAGDRLLHLQVAENYRGIPGTGNAPWEAYLSGLKKINYSGGISIESFTPNNKELAAAVCIWKNLAPDQDTFGREGLRFLKNWINN